LSVIGLLGALGGYFYYANLPKPLLIQGTILAPSLTPNVENPVPDILQIEFSYDDSRLKPDQPRPEGDPSVARIDLIDKKLTQGIQIEPVIPGVWMWRGDRHLEFKPQKEWSAGVEYTIHVDKSVFSEETRVKQSSYAFQSHPFDVTVSELDFYQDPEDKSIRRVAGTIKFSHPVDKDSLEAHLTMKMRPSDTSIDTEPAPVAFTTRFDENQREAYVLSAPIKLPENPNYMTLTIARGVVPTIGGAPSENERSRQVLVPDIYSFFKVSKGATRIVPNEKQEPEQVLMLSFTDDVSEQALMDKLGVYLLPAINKKRNGKYWNSPREVTEEVLNASQKLEVKLIPNERSFSKTFNFVFDAPENRYLYLNVKPGLTSISNFVQASFYDSVLHVPAYPKQIKIMGDGALLARSGTHQISLLARGLTDIKVSIGKVLPGQLYHLISQTGGDIKDPYFSNYRFSSHNVSEFEEEIISLKPTHPKMANYASMDLTPYLSTSGTRAGLFFIEVSGWDRHNKRKISGAADKRLIMISDLGLLVKNNSNHSHDVFAQSITSGYPIKNATVELLGINGLTLYTATTDSDGHTRFPGTKDFKREKQPNVYVVTAGNDISFIPFSRASRQINYSRFDVGGIAHQTGRDDNLTGYIFTDRGIYRPGEAVKLGLIVKNADLSDVSGIPLEIAIRDPRNNQAKIHKFKLAEKGFFDYTYPTGKTSETGKYNVYVYLVDKNGYRGRMIGSADFRVEEFQPDTLKIESRLVGAEKKGWVSAKSIRAAVTLENLFGTPARDRKVVGRISVRPTAFKFKEYENYTFNDLFKDKQKRPLRIEETFAPVKTDADGLAGFDISLERFTQGTYRLDFGVEGFEAGGGRSVSAQNTVLLSPLTYLVGVKSNGPLSYINKDAEQSVELIAISDTLERIEKPALTIILKEIQHVSTLVQQKNGTYKYQTVDRETERNTGVMDISKDGTRYRLPTSAPGDFALEVLDESGLQLCRIQFTVVGHGNLAGRLEKSAELRLALNKKDYKPGEVIEMNITAPYAGSGLITIESDRVHAYKWFSADTQSTMETITVPEDLEANAYVNVAFIRDIESKDIFTSPLSYAVAPFTIDRSKRRIDITMKIADIVRPGSPMEIKYKTSTASRIVVFAVDEGILQVAGYHPPAPLDHFLRKRALGVTTLQILDLILPEFELVKAISASGGGMSAEARALAKNLNPFARKTDAPAVFWSGIMDADTEEKTVSFMVPDTFSGNLKVMAVAVSDTAMDAAQSSTLVRGPFVISPNVLTQAAPGDIFNVTVGVTNMVENSGKNAAITVAVEPSKHLEIIGDRETVLTISEGDEGKAHFKVKATPLPGAAQLKLTATLGNETAHRTASLSVRPAIPYYSSFESGFEKDGSIELAIKRVLFPDLAEQKVSASASPLVLVDGLSTYLEKFPHGCTEQVVSQVFPLIGLMTHPGFEPHSEKIRDQFAVLMDRLRERQLANGGFIFWPGGRTAAEYPSVYVMHFLIEANDLGYPVPRDMMQRGKAFLHQYVGKAASNMEAAGVRANAIYLLTRMGEITTNYLVHLQTSLENGLEKDWKQDLTAVYMAATYHLLQKQDQADELIRHYKTGKKPERQYSDFHSPLTQDAQYIYLLARHFEGRIHRMEGEALLPLIDPIFKGEYNTISAAYSILALGACSKLKLENNVDEQYHLYCKKGK